MGKSHRDNTAARKKRGQKAFLKKAKRRKAKTACEICGTNARPKSIENGICAKCRERIPA